MSIKKVFPEIITLGIIVILAVCYPLVSRGLQSAPPLMFAALRTFIAGISIFLLLSLIRQPLVPPKGTWKWAILLALPAVTFTYATMFLSHENPKMALLPILENLQPFLSVFFAGIFLHEKLTSATRYILWFGALGLFFLTIQSLTGDDGFDFRSAVLALLASISATAASIVIKRLKRPDLIATLSAWQLIIGSLPLFVFSWFTETNTKLQWNMSFVSILAFLALIGTGATTVIWYSLIQKFGVSRLSVLFFLLPVFGLVMTNWLYAVPVSALEWIGALIILSGVALGLKKQSAYAE